MKPPHQQLIEELAAIEHDQWVYWSKEIASTESIRPNRLERWKTLWVPYKDLPEIYKDDDRKWARKGLECCARYYDEKTNMLLNNDPIINCLNNPNDSAVKRATRYMDRIMEKYREENPCPVCGSHNVNIDIECICGADMSGSEWCDDCGWKKITDTRKEAPELMICPDVARCNTDCFHRTPHKRMVACSQPSQCSIATTGMCVPYKPDERKRWEPTPDKDDAQTNILRDCVR